MIDVNSIEWGPTKTFDQGGISHLRTVGRSADKHLLDGVLNPPLHSVWWARLDPGGFVVPHIDAGPPFYERWHFPVQAAGFFWEDGVYYEPTEPFMVRHWRPHAVWNPTDTPRIHLMAEREVIPPDAPESSPLILTEMIPEIQAMIDELGGQDG